MNIIIINDNVTGSSAHKTTHTDTVISRIIQVLITIRKLYVTTTIKISDCNCNCCNGHIKFSCN